jgi:hypothetical protein
MTVVLHYSELRVEVVLEVMPCINDNINQGLVILVSRILEARPAKRRFQFLEPATYYRKYEFYDSKKTWNSDNKQLINGIGIIPLQRRMECDLRRKEMLRNVVLGVSLISAAEPNSVSMLCPRARTSHRKKQSS